MFIKWHCAVLYRQENAMHKFADKVIDICDVLSYLFLQQTLIECNYESKIAQIVTASIFFVVDFGCLIYMVILISVFNGFNTKFQAKETTYAMFMSAMWIQGIQTKWLHASWKTKPSLPGLWKTIFSGYFSFCTSGNMHRNRRKYAYANCGLRDNYLDPLNST